MGFCRFRPVWIVIAALLAAGSGCASLKKGFSPKQDPKIAAIQREIRRIERSNGFTQTALKDMDRRLDALQRQVNELNASVKALSDRCQKIAASPPSSKPATGSTTQGAAPPKVSPAQKARVSKKSVKHAVAKKPSTPKRSSMSQAAPQQAYNKAYAAYQAQHYDEARTLFKRFLSKYPDHPLADNAQYWIGETYYDAEDFPNAILAFKEVATKYSDENKAPDALLKIGYAYIALDDPANARLFLKRVIKNYPFSSAEAKAREKLKELENLP
ncbi:MAG: tol-pal system protein YbgF [Deltaproteobacteria bacterium]|nr:tol-pal system protein YbgF [Deltaproteobacteria bacterium]